MLGVEYHGSDKVYVTGIFPYIKICNLYFQYPKLGMQIIHFFPILSICSKTFLGLCVACKVSLKITISKAWSGKFIRSSSASPCITDKPFDTHSLTPW